MLIMCLFSLSAILAPVLIAIYILQHFTLGKEPTLMVPNWQSRAVKRQTICCLLRGGWSALASVCARVCMCVHACAWCACMSTHVRVHAVSACMDAHSCVRGMCETGGEGVSQEAAGHFPFVQRDPALPPGLPTRPHRSAGAPREALEPEGSRDQAPSLLSAALLTCISVPSPGRLHWEHVDLRQWWDLIPISARPPRPLCVHVVGRRCLLRPRTTAQDRPWWWAWH